jgi:hypothetical protein
MGVLCQLSNLFSWEMKMKRVFALALALALAGSLYAAEPPQDASTPAAKGTRKQTPPKKSGPTISTQLSELKQAMEAQQQQIQQLSQQVQSRDQHIQQLEQRLDQSQAAAAQAQAKADAAASQTAEESQTVSSLKSDVTDLRSNATSVALTLQETQKNLHDQLESPLAIHFKGITITPGGFLAGESVYRNRALSGEATPFNSLSMPGSGQNAISEFFGSGRQSRISMLAEGKVNNTKLTGYYEADFLAAGVTSNNNQTNSYVLRQRQVWSQAAFSNGWSFTAGQMWTLATENRKGVDNRTEAVPSTIDPNYTAGFSFARQWGVRVAKKFDNHFWLAASLENPQTTFAASGNASNFAFGGAGVGGGLYNSTTNYSFNAMPDIILKAAFEPGFGHYEVFGIMSRFRDRVYPCAEATQNPALCGESNSTLGAYNSSKNGGGLGGNARFTAFKHMEFGLHGLFGNGVGRYGASGLPDATVNPNGTLAPLRSYQGLATLEFHYPRLDVYFNGGEEYVGRRFSIDPGSGKTVGYGAPAFVDSGCYTETIPSAGSGFGFGSLANCSGNTQRVIEGSLGFWIKLHSGPKGRLQFGPQYSYVARDAWTGTGATAGTFVAPHGIDNMFFTSFRYYLP